MLEYELKKAEEEIFYIKSVIEGYYMNIHNHIIRLGIYSVQPMGLEKWGAETFQGIVGGLAKRLTGSNEVTIENLKEATIFAAVIIQTTPYIHTAIEMIRGVYRKGMGHIPFYKG